MQEILDAIQAQQFDALAGVDVPDHYRGVTVHADEVDMFAGIPSAEKDPRKSLHVEDVPTPELGPGEAIIAVMASAINYNTVWTSIFEPVSSCARGPASTRGRGATGWWRTASPSSWRAPTATATR